MFKRFALALLGLLAVGSLYAQPTINIVANAAADTAATGNVARGELISIYGTGLATSLGGSCRITGQSHAVAATDKISLNITTTSNFSNVSSQGNFATQPIVIALHCK